MDSENIRKLLEKHEIPGPTPCWSQIGDGWVSIVDRLMTDLIAMGWEKEISQIKEKFGGLRFYAAVETDAMRDRIDQAEEEAARTCEMCGKPGILRKRAWWKTLCEDCNEV